MEGKLSPKQLRLINAWIEIHKEELLANWNLCQNSEKPFPIEPLKYASNIMYPSVKEVVPESDYILILKFSNGDKRRFDMKPFLDNGVFEELKDISKFNTVHVSFDSIEWENEADFDPEVLYMNSIKL